MSELINTVTCSMLEQTKKHPQTMREEGGGVAVTPHRTECKHTGHGVQKHTAGNVFDIFIHLFKHCTLCFF